MDGRAHFKRYGKKLEVHRIVPCSDYSLKWGDCVTLCETCHDALHGQGNWGWISTDDPSDNDQLARLVRRSAERDIKDEREWRRRESWGAQLRELRETIAGVSLRSLALSTDISERMLRHFENGRREPLLLEAKLLANALNVTLDELAREQGPDDGWLESCKKRSEARALAFRAREANDGEVLARGATVVWEVVGKADQARQDARQAAEMQHSIYLRSRKPLSLGESVLTQTSNPRTDEE